MPGKYRIHLQSYSRERNAHKREGYELKFLCRTCKSNTQEKGISDQKCCATYVLSHEPDFLKWEEWLTEVVHNVGLQVSFEFHFEFYFIEIVWGWSHHTCNCKYNFKDLQDKLPVILKELLPFASIGKFQQHCLIFMS